MKSELLAYSSLAYSSPALAMCSMAMKWQFTQLVCLFNV